MSTKTTFCVVSDVTAIVFGCPGQERRAVRPRVRPEIDRAHDFLCREVDDRDLVAGRAGDSVDRDDAPLAVGRHDRLVRTGADIERRGCLRRDVDDRCARRLLIGDEHRSGGDARLLGRGDGSERSRRRRMRGVGACANLRTVAPHGQW